ncbi:hypothetical protein CRUP_017455, partial [Coryphaenoides rupestris]
PPDSHELEDLAKPGSPRAGPRLSPLSLCGVLWWNPSCFLLGTNSKACAQLPVSLMVCRMRIIWSRVRLLSPVSQRRYWSNGRRAVAICSRLALAKDRPPWLERSTSAPTTYTVDGSKVDQPVPGKQVQVASGRLCEQQAVPDGGPVAAEQLAAEDPVRLQAAQVEVEGVQRPAVPALHLHQLRHAVPQLVRSHVRLVAHVEDQRLAEAQGLEPPPALQPASRYDIRKEFLGCARSWSLELCSRSDLLFSCLFALLFLWPSRIARYFRYFFLEVLVDNSAKDRTSSSVIWSGTCFPAWRQAETRSRVAASTEWSGGPEGSPSSARRPSAAAPWDLITDFHKSRKRPERKPRAEDPFPGFQVRVPETLKKPTVVEISRSISNKLVGSGF